MDRKSFVELSNTAVFEPFKSFYRVAMAALSITTAFLGGYFLPIPMQGLFFVDSESISSILLTVAVHAGIAFLFSRLLIFLLAVLIRFLPFLRAKFLLKQNYKHKAYRRYRRRGERIAEKFLLSVEHPAFFFLFGVIFAWRLGGSYALLAILMAAAVSLMLVFSVHVGPEYPKRFMELHFWLGARQGARVSSYLLVMLSSLLGLTYHLQQRSLPLYLSISTSDVLLTPVARRSAGYFGFNQRTCSYFVIDDGHVLDLGYGMMNHSECKISQP